MPLSMPSSGLLNQQLGKFGLAAKASQTLFSPMQSPAAVAPERTSMQYDRYATSLSPLKMTDLSAPDFGWGSQAKPPSLVGGLGQNQSPGFPGMGGSSGPAGSLGGEYAVLDQYDQFFQDASAQTGMPVNVLKAIAAVERGWEGTSVAGAQGIMQVMPFWGSDFGLNLQDPRQNILAGAKVLKSGMDQYGNMDMAIRSYLGFGTDAYGTSDSAYLDRFNGFLNQLNQSGGQFGTVAPIDGMWGGNPVGNAFVDQALKYQGVNYVWGSIPGAGQDPFQTGWDCSGFTYFMNQSYGDKDLPMGSHYQYQYAQNNGRLFTDLSQLQPGDLVFINTGWQGGAGAELNQAGHVGIYIGNGQMIHAANPSTGTIVSPLSGYGNILGGMHQMGASGGGGVSSGYHGSGGNPVTGYTSPSAAMSWQDKFRRFMEGQ
jgi:cell wall-associated NlpC family hydrolase